MGPVFFICISDFETAGALGGFLGIGGGIIMGPLLLEYCDVEWIEMKFLEHVFFANKRLTRSNCRCLSSLGVRSCCTNHRSSTA